MNTQHSIKRGVSLYSYQYETFLRKMTLDDCIAHAAGLGAKGIEVVSEQSFTGFPNVPQAQIEGSEGRAITTGSGEKTKHFVGQTYLFHYALPHFYFHATTAYDILRHNGLEIGKKDFIGSY